MKVSKLCLNVALAACALGAAAAVHAEEAGAIQRAASATERGLVRAKNATVHGVKMAASGLARGIDKTGQVLRKGARKAGISDGQPSQPSASEPVGSRR